MVGILSRFRSLDYLQRVVSTPLIGLKFSVRLIVKIFALLFHPFIAVENEERLRSLPEPVIFSFNHNNSFETVLLASYLLYVRDGKKVDFVVDWMFGAIPLVGWFVRQVEPVWVYKKKARFEFIERRKGQPGTTDSVDECINRLRGNRSIAIFPEGKRNKDPYRLMSGRTGIGRIALGAGVRVVPIGVDFPNRLKKGKIPSFGAMILRIGEPLDFASDLAEAKKWNAIGNLTDGRRQKILHYLEKRVVHAVMLELAKLSGKEYPYPAPDFPLENPPDSTADFLFPGTLPHHRERTYEDRNYQDS